MMIVAHRINKVAQVKKLDSSVGVEIDVRGWGKDLVLNHEPLEEGDLLDDYLAAAGSNRFVIFNIKEAGIEGQVHTLAAKHGIKNYFLLDVEFPYMYQAARAGERRLAVRYSEDESIETVLKYKGLVDWVWIDTNTRLPLDVDLVKKLQGFRLCLVCPERWGRPADIAVYQEKLSKLGVGLDAVMTASKYIDEWRNFTQRRDPLKVQR